jgi:hypothetical protein
MFEVEVFMNSFNAAKSIDYDSSWGDNSTYYENAVSLNNPNRINLPIGDTAKSVDDDGNKLLFVGAKKGTIVIFELQNERRRDRIAFTEPSDEFCAQGVFPKPTDQNLLLMLRVEDSVIN